MSQFGSRRLPATGFQTWLLLCGLHRRRSIYQSARPSLCPRLQSATVLTEMRPRSEEWSSSASDYSWLRNLGMRFLPNVVQHRTEPPYTIFLRGLGSQVYKELSLWQNRACRSPGTTIAAALPSTPSQSQIPEANFRDGDRGTATATVSFVCEFRASAL